MGGRTGGRTALRWLPLIALYTLGMSSPPLLPIWLAGAARRFQFTTAQSGLAASLELGCLACASLLWAALPHRRRRSMWLAAALGLSLAGNVASFLAANAATLIAARAMSGFCLGLTLSEITGQAARSANAQRVFALQQLGLVVFLFAFFATVPTAIASYGPSAPFLYAAALSLLALASTPWLRAPDDKPGMPAMNLPSPRTADRTALPSVGLTLSALALTYLAQTGIWTYIADLARNSGVGLQSLGRILAVGAVTNLLAPLAAERMGLRCGRLAPLLIGYCGLAAAMLLLAFGLGPQGFAVGAIGLNLFLLFLTPFLLDTLAALDASGRSASAGPAAFTIGGAVGPALAGMIIGKAGFAVMGATAAGAALCGLALALTAVVKVPRRSVSGQPA